MAFIGRERELARLAGALTRAAEGQIARAVVVASAGIGATRLLDELQTRVSDLPDVAIVRATAYEPLAGVPYAPVSAALGRTLLRLPDDDLLTVVGNAGHDLCALVPPLAARLGEAAREPDLAAPEQVGSRVTESLVGTLERLATARVVLLALEDLHWADPGTRTFVDALLRLSRPLRLCVLVTYQPDELHRRHPMRDLARRLEREPRAERLMLDPLGRDELYRLIEGLSGERPSASLLATVMEGSGGNPLLAAQLVTAHESLAAIRLSDSFEEIVHARLDALSPGAVRTLRVLSAAVRPITRATLFDVELPEGRATAPALEQALRSGLAVDLGDDHVGVVHTLHGEAIEQLASSPERLGLHAGLARALRGPAAEEAWHREAAMDLRGARDAHARAGAAAERLEPGTTAFLHYQRALELTETDQTADAATGLSSVRLLDSAANAAFVSGAFRKAAALTQQAITRRAAKHVVARAAAASDGDARDLQLEVGQRYERLGRYSWTGGDQRTGLSSFETALELIPLDALHERARALAALAQHLMIEGRFEASIPIAEQARVAAAAAGRAALAEHGHATCTLGVDLAYTGDLDRGLALLEEATTTARAAGRLDDLMRSYANRTTLLDLDSRREAAIEVVQEGMHEARRGGLEHVYGAFLRGNAADILFTLGRWREAEAECRAALEWSPSGVAWLSPVLYLALVLAESRADEEATRLVGQTLLQVETIPVGQWSAIAQRAAVSLALWRGDVEDAQRLAEREWDRVLETHDATQIARAASTTLEACAAAAEAARDRDDYGGVASATELGRRVLEGARQQVAQSGLPATLGARREADLHIQTAAGHLRRVRGRSDMAIWERIAVAWRAIPVPYESAKARWWQAIAALQGAREDADRRKIARAALQDAWAIAVDLPAEPLQRAVADLAGRARIPLPEQQAAVPVAVGAEPFERDLVAVGPGRPSPKELAAADARDVDVRDDIEHWPLARVIELASSATGRAIGERFLTDDRAAGEDRFGLSPRESEVLRVLVEGRSNREIADRLFISDRTVGVHVRRILAKLGVSGRVEAAALAIRLGLVPSDAPLASLASGRRRG